MSEVLINIDRHSFESVLEPVFSALSIFIKFVIKNKAWDLLKAEKKCDRITSSKITIINVGGKI